MHVISQDFISQSLKNKKHWNSFTTAFFKDYEEIENELNEKGEVRVSARDEHSFDFFFSLD